MPPVEVIVPMLLDIYAVSFQPPSLFVTKPLAIDQWQEEFMADQQLHGRAGGGALAVSDTQRDDMFTWLQGVGGQRGAGA